ncbi:hypothetical protein N7493_006821 [Penicillium malachiteum]|uniref:Uncharacterized protein n=1 Tax=Penicillium malachiteum TaxID=1324776 RepID=A0AAD6HJH7_9EURO|nr:hypothetical protein N7493_006821 [Penicillium malachiteum]
MGRCLDISSTEVRKAPHQSYFTLDELAKFFTEGNLRSLMRHDQLMEAVYSFKHHARDGSITYGGPKAPSCGETDLSESYNPQMECHCDQEPYSKDGSINSTQLCGAHQGMLDAMYRVLDRQDEWNSVGTAHLIPEIEAPDRCPNPGVDGSKFIFNQLYPTPEQIKICADAKYYGVTACGVGLCDEGLARAIADSCNDVLIGDYCETADDKGLRLLQQTGAAAVSFLKLCNMAGRVSDWQSTGQQLTEQQFMKTVEACVYINDFVDFRGDTMRKQRENPILRGIEGNVCAYLDRMIAQCLDAVNEIMESSNAGALVAMGYCNWAILGSHHKVYELLSGAVACLETIRYPG